MTYEYLCTACGAEWEAEQSISAPPLKDCPKCGQATAKRQISGGAGFILKGGGWYADGYGSAKPQSAEAKDAKSDTKGADSKSKGESKTDAKTTESKPETKSEPKPEPKGSKASSASSEAA
jgi:putative FmdB family regulatory protein